MGLDFLVTTQLHNVNIHTCGAGVYFNKYLKKLGFSCEALPTSLYYYQADVSQRNTYILETLKRVKPKIFLIIKYSDILTADLLEECKKYCGKIVYYSADEPYNYFEDEDKSFVKEMAVADMILCSSPEVLEEYMKQQKYIYMWHRFADSEVMYYSPNLYYACDISIAGVSYEHRIELSKYLIENGIDLSFFGLREQWGKLYPERYMGHIREDLMSEVFSSNKINLSTVLQTNKWLYSPGGRVFHSLACKGFILLEYRKGVETYFDIDKEIVCYNSKEELLDKIKYYLSNPEIRNKIAQQGQFKVFEEYLFLPNLVEFIKYLQVIDFL